MTDPVDEYKSDPIIRTNGGAALFLERHRNAKKLYPCYLGHVECSPDLHGPCLDETLSNFAND